MTNGEKIRSMTDEELAEFLDKVVGCDFCPIKKFCDEERTTPYVNCETVWSRWLSREVKND